jgi:hypothetical protein
MSRVLLHFMVNIVRKARSQKAQSEALSSGGELPLSGNFAKLEIDRNRLFSSHLVKAKVVGRFLDQKRGWGSNALYARREGETN